MTRSCLSIPSTKPLVKFALGQDVFYHCTVLLLIYIISVVFSQVLVYVHR